MILLGLASRRFPAAVPAFLGKQPGDALWALTVFLILGLIFRRRSTLFVGTAALGISFAIELSQLYHAPWIDAARRNTVGHLILGFGFDWRDMMAYVVGVLAGAAGEWLAGVGRTPNATGPSSALIS